MVISKHDVGREPPVPAGDVGAREPFDPTDIRVEIKPRDLARLDDEYFQAIRGRLTKFGLARSPYSWLLPHIRTENINLHTTFAQRRKLDVDWVGKIALVVFLGVFGEAIAVLVLLGLPYFVVPFVILAILALAVLVASVWALPRTGWWYQSLRQTVGANSWLYDLLNALRRPPGIGMRLLLWYAGSAIASGGFAWLVDVVLGISEWPLGIVWILAISALTLTFLLWTGVMWHDRVGRDLGRDRSGSLPQQVHRLSMVQALSWTPLPEYLSRTTNGTNQLSPQRPLIFVSTFNEGIDGYVGGFVEGMGQQLDGAWGLSPGFPPANRGFRPFMEYVDRTSYPLQHSFVAYPHCSVVDIRNALHLDRTYRSLWLEMVGRKLTAARYEQFVQRVRLALPSVPTIPRLLPATSPQLEIQHPTDRSTDPLVARNIGSARTATRTTILVSVLHFAREHSEAVIDAVKALPGGFPERDGVFAHVRSPFMTVPGTHYARLTVVDDWNQPHHGPRQALHFERLPHGVTDADEVQPAAAWLLLAAQFDSVGKYGDVYWLAELHRALAAEVGALEGIFGHARTQMRPDADLTKPMDFVRLVLCGRSEPNVCMIDHPDNTTWDVLRSLRTHRVVSHYLRETPPDDPQIFINEPELLPLRP